MKNKKNLWILILLFFPSMVYANAGLPLISFEFSGLMIALVPVIIVEALILKRMLTSKYGETFLIVGISNIVTTIIGYPLSWLLRFLIEMGLSHLESFFGISLYENSYSLFFLNLFAGAIIPQVTREFYWVIPVAIIGGLFYSFVISFLVEYFFYMKFFAGHTKKDLFRASLISNIVTYSVLISIVLAFIIYGFAIGFYI